VKVYTEYITPRAGPL